MRTKIGGFLTAVVLTTPVLADAPNPKPLFFQRHQVAEVWPVFQDLHGDRFPVGPYAAAHLEHIVVDLNNDGVNELILRSTEAEACQLSACPTIVAEFNEGSWGEIGMIYSTLIEAGEAENGYARLHVYDTYDRRIDPVAYRMENGRYDLDLTEFGVPVALAPIEGDGFPLDDVIGVLERSLPQESLLVRSSRAPGDRIVAGEGDVNHDGEPETFLRVEHASVCMPEVGCPTLVVSDPSKGAFAAFWSAPGTDLVLSAPGSWDQLMSIIARRKDGLVRLDWSRDSFSYEEHKL